MHRLFLLFVGVCTALAWGTPALASGDVGCEAEWKLTHQGVSDCTNMAMLVPSNDSRINLILLMADARASGSNGLAMPDEGKLTPFLENTGMENGAPVPSDETTDSSFSDGEGSRCRSNAPGTASFEAALMRNRKISPRDRDLLVAARHALQPACAADGKAPPPNPATTTVTSAAAKAFATYLEGASAFYAADYDTAAARFVALGDAGDPWLRETSRYMLGRVEVNRAQVGYYDEYGAPAKDKPADPKILAAAEAALRGYMKTYPKGAYFNSARGLVRRVHWLARDWRALAADYSAMLAMSPESRGIDDVTLMQEIDAKLPYDVPLDAVTSPALLATLDLMQLRTGEQGGTVLTEAALEAQRTRFSINPALFDYLRAAQAFYVAKRPADVLKLIPDASHQRIFTSLDFSRQMVRGLALEALRDRNARGFWIDLLPGATRPYQRPAIELALALHDERSGALDGLFAQGSPVRTADIREILLVNVADAALLRRQAVATYVSQHERDVALFTLLFKEATRGPHRDFLTDLALVPKDAPTSGNFYDPVAMEHPPVGVFNQPKDVEGYACPALRETELALTQRPDDSHGLLCVAEFVRANGFDYAPLGATPKPDELGGTRPLFPGGTYSRLDDYRAIIAARGAPSDDKAYALFRAINCYAPSRINSCGGKEAEPAERKTWFFQLKRQFPRSRWARDLQYYW